MTYVVTENCISVNTQTVLRSARLIAFMKVENFLVINPDECIDCGVCRVGMSGGSHPSRF